MRPNAGRPVQSTALIRAQTVPSGMIARNDPVVAQHRALCRTFIGGTEIRQASNPAGSLIDKGILLTGIVSDRIGMTLLFIVLAPLVREVDISEFQFGILISAANVTLLISAPYWGSRSQTLGRKSVFVIGMAGYALSYTLIAFAMQAGLWGRLMPWTLFFVLLAGRLFFGLVAAGIQPAATAYFADITDQTNRSKGMAQIGVAAGIGTIVGPIAGGTLAMVSALFPMYAAAGFAALITAVAYVFLQEPAQHTERSNRSKLRFFDARIFPYLLGWCLLILVFTSIQVVTAFYLEDRFHFAGRQELTWATTIAFLSMGAATVLIQLIVLQMFRIPPKTLLRAGFLLYGLALLLLALAPNPLILYCAYALLGAGFGLMTPGLNAAASISVEAHEQGDVAGLLTAAPVLGMIIGPLLGPPLYKINMIWPMLLGAAIMIAMGIYYQFTAVPDPSKDS